MNGYNAGFSFCGTGAGNLPFGGVQFGYSDNVVRMFYPNDSTSCLVRIGPFYGGGMYQQCARRAMVKFTMWNGELLALHIECMNRTFVTIVQDRDADGHL